MLLHEPQEEPRPEATPGEVEAVRSELAAVQAQLRRCEEARAESAMSIIIIRATVLERRVGRERAWVRERALCMSDIRPRVEVTSTVELEPTRSQMIAISDDLHREIRSPALSVEPNRRPSPSLA